MPVRVSCAVLMQGNSVLAVRRGPNMKMAGKWEFPGGKLEQGESAESSLLREMQEELQLEIAILQPLLPVVHAYSDIEIELIPFLVKHIGGTLQLSEHDAFQWSSVEQLMQFDWAAADLPIVKQVMELHQD
jgi:8-oxo-dGTP diphosphatase